MKGYSLQKHHGNWIVRWSEYKDGKGTQPTHILASVKVYPKKSEVEPLAQEYMQGIRKTRTVRAGASVKQFVDGVFFPSNKDRLSINTVKLYRQAWGRLEAHLGYLRLRDVRTCDVQAALDAIHAERGEELGHDVYMHCKVTCSAIFSLALRLGHHPGPNPENGTSVRGWGHNHHRENAAATLEEIKQLLMLFPSGDVSVAIGINAFLALRKPEAEGLLPDDYDPQTHRVRIHRDTKTGNDEWLPVVAPLRKLLECGWNQINMRRAERAILKAIKGTSLRWKGWYSLRRGMLTNLWSLGIRVEEACLILRNSPEVCRKHYLRLDAAVSKAETMAKLEAAYDKTEITVQ